MIVAIGSLQRAANGIIRSGDYSTADAPEDFIAYQPLSPDYPVVVLSGSGSERAARATRWAIEQFEPEAIVSFGFCEATKDLPRPGDIVIASRVINLPGTPFEWSVVDKTNSLGPDRTLLLSARTAVEIAGLDYHHGTVVTVSKLATTPGIKSWLGETVNATAADTESFSVASAAHEAGVAWAVVASVLDDRDFDVPSIIDRVGAGPNERGILAYIRYVSNSPLDLPALMRLGRLSTRASTSLGAFMTAFMEARAALIESQPASKS